MNGVNILIDAVVLIRTKAKDMEGMNIGLVKNDTRSPLPLKLYLVTLSDANTPIKMSNTVATTASLILFKKPEKKSVCPVNIF